MSKTLNLTVNNCEECPLVYWEYDYDYSNPGIYCRYDKDAPNIPNKDEEYYGRLVISEGNYEDLVANHDGPIVGKDHPPRWCPLPDLVVETE